MRMAPFERALDLLRYSSMPGSSRHHWGTDVDVHSLDPETFEAEKVPKCFSGFGRRLKLRLCGSVHRGLPSARLPA